MVNRIDGYWIETISSFSALQEFTLPALPPGTNVYANISVSFVDTVFFGNSPDPKFVAAAFIDSWTFYQSDGTESAPQPGSGFNQNAVAVDNCASIKFILFVEQAWAIAQINIFTL